MVTSNRRSFFKLIAAFAVLPAVGDVRRSFAKQPSGLRRGRGGGRSSQGASCVHDFFKIARKEYGLSPREVVDVINNDDDPTFQVKNVHDLRKKVASAEIGIFDTAGNYHICPNPA